MINQHEKGRHKNWICEENRKTGKQKNISEEEQGLETEKLRRGGGGGREIERGTGKS